jgi:hypothetical protein
MFDIIFISLCIGIDVALVASVFAVGYRSIRNGDHLMPSR